MKRRLDQPPLPQPQLTLAGDKSVAEQALQQLVVLRLQVVGVVLLQNVLDAIGVGDKKHRNRTEFEFDDVAIPPECLPQEAKRAIGTQKFEATKGAARTGSFAQGAP